MKYALLTIALLLPLSANACYPWMQAVPEADPTWEVKDGLYKWGLRRCGKSWCPQVP